MLASKIDEVKAMRERMLQSLDSVSSVKDTITENRYSNMYFEMKTNMEIHPSLLLGEINTNVPFANRNPGPRNIFQYSQGRQAMGIYATNYINRTDISYILYHPQKPIITFKSV
jgi:DNA-directed RNA polymerase II subunit RPB2